MFVVRSITSLTTIEVVDGEMLLNVTNFKVTKTEKGMV